MLCTNEARPQLCGMIWLPEMVLISQGLASLPQT